MSPRARLVLAFVVLFVAYEAPEGVGRLLGSFAWTAGLMLFFHPVAFAVGRGLGFRSGFGAYALGWDRRQAAVLALALGIALLLKPALLLGASSAGLFTRAPVEPTANLAPTIAVLALSTFVPSLAEDIVARGFWFRAWPVAGQGARYVVFAAGMFVLTHVYRLANGPLEWAVLFVTGLAYAAAVARTGTLWGAVGLHWGWNLSNGLVDLFVDVNPTTSWARPVVSMVTGALLLAAVWLLPRCATSPRRGPELTPPSLR